MICGFVRVLLRFSGDSARSVTVAASNAVQASRIDKTWNMGLLIRSWQRSRVEELISLNRDSAETGYLRVSRIEEKACHPTTRLSRLASPRKDVARGAEGGSHEQQEKCPENRGRRNFHPGPNRFHLCAATQRRFQR